MATIQKVAQIDDNIKIKRVLVSCTNKIGLISNAGMEIEGYPEIFYSYGITYFQPGIWDIY